MKKKIVSMIVAIMLSMTAFSSVALATNGMWKSDSIGWWYMEPNGTYPTNSWKQVGDDWYHFDGNGYMQTGWFWDNDCWYYLSDSGSMLHDVNNVVINGVAYSFDHSGIMKITNSATSIRYTK